jgi:hypothetical protein
MSAMLAEVMELAQNSHTQVNNRILLFDNLINAVLNGTFHMTLPTAFKKVSGSAAASSLESKQPANSKNKGVGKDGKGCKKRKSEDMNGNIIKNTTQPNKFKLPHVWPAWTDKTRMCARWHLKGNCFNNCSRAISHVRNDKILTINKQLSSPFLPSAAKR